MRELWPRNCLVVPPQALFWYYGSLRARGKLTNSREKMGQILAAWLCLLAAVFLYAPLAAASWSVHARTCCIGDHCPILGHHHRQAAPAEQPSHADCEHEMGEAMNCSMSCCENSEKLVVTPLTFTLSRPVTMFASIAAVPASEVSPATAIAQSIEPVSPPPRSMHAL
jgi:hypothetical protein